MFKSIIEKYKGSLAILMKKPILLWGLTLLAQLLSFLAVPFGVLPIISLPISWALSVGLSMLYLKGYRGNGVETDDVFVGFKNFKHNVLGMGWMQLWTLIWLPVPIMNIIKSYEYCFTPYILVEMPELSPTEALKKSKEMTAGYKLQMFLSDLLVGAGVTIIMLVLGVLAVEIPYIGLIFRLILFAFRIAVVLFAPIFLGLIRAGFYDHSKLSRTPMTLPLTDKDYE